MLSLHLHPDQVEWLVGELRKAGDREIGGVLVGEHMGQDTFRLADLSVQRAGGTKSCFVCEPKHHESFLQEFFDRTGHAFTRFNYIGEWHSHPLFSVGPSEVDLRQMQLLVDDANGQRLFAVLLVVRLGDDERLEISGLLFRAGAQPEAVRVTVVARHPCDGEPKREPWWARALRRRRPRELVVFTVASVGLKDCMAVEARDGVEELPNEGKLEGDNAEAQRLRTEAIQRQEVVQGDLGIARKLSAAARVEGYQSGQVLIESNGKDDDLHLILCGSADVIVKGQRVATRKAGQHVGEMALIDPTARRSATVRALEETVTAAIPESTFTAIAKDHPELWRRLALELAKRLRERADHVKPVRERPVLFVASSKEGLPIARAIQTACQHDSGAWVTRLWTDGVFGAGHSPIESLTAQLEQLDFGVVVVTPDDVLESRDSKLPSPRDNVVFELGLLMGALGRDRAFMARSLEDRDMKLPSDLVGVQPLAITGGLPEDLPSRVGPAVSELREIIKKLGGKKAG